MSAASPAARQHVAHLRLGSSDTLDDLHDRLEGARREGGAYVVCLEIDGLRGPAAPLRWLELFQLPVICAFEGALSGAAAAAALACDIRICGSRASIGAAPESHLRLQRLLLDATPRERLVAGHSLDAPGALACGLVTAVTEPGAASAGAMHLAQVIASRGPIAVRLAKEAIWRGLEMPLEQALRFETDLTLLLQTANDRAEGVRAFLEKRAPRFGGD